MSLTVECDVCGKQYRVPDKYAGRTLNCKNCRSPMEVPESYDDDEENLTADDLLDTAWPPKTAGEQSSSSTARSGTRRNVVERESGWNRRFLPIGSWLAPA